VNTGLTFPNVYALAIDPATPSTLYAGSGGGGVFRSLNGGSSWSAVNTGLTSTGVRRWRSTRRRRRRSTPDHRRRVPEPERGGSWSAVNTGLTSLYVYAVVIDATTASTLYAGPPAACSGA